MKKYRIECTFRYEKSTGFFGLSKRVYLDEETYHIEADDEDEAKEIAERLIDKEITNFTDSINDERDDYSQPASDADVESEDVTYEYDITEE